MVSKQISSHRSQRQRYGDNAFKKRKQKVGRRKLKPTTSTDATVHSRGLRIGVSRVLMEDMKRQENDDEESQDLKKHQAEIRVALGGAATHVRATARLHALRAGQRWLLEILKDTDQMNVSTNNNAVDPVRQLQLLDVALQSLTDTQVNIRHVAGLLLQLLLRPNHHYVAMANATAIARRVIQYVNVALTHASGSVRSDALLILTSLLYPEIKLLVNEQKILDFERIESFVPSAVSRVLWTKPSFLSTWISSMENTQQPSATNAVILSMLLQNAWAVTRQIRRFEPIAILLAHCSQSITHSLGNTETCVPHAQHSFNIMMDSVSQISRNCPTQRNVLQDKNLFVFQNIFSFVRVLMMEFTETLQQHVYSLRSASWSKQVMVALREVSAIIHLLAFGLSHVASVNSPSSTLLRSLLICLEPLVQFSSSCLRTVHRGSSSYKSNSQYDDVLSLAVSLAHLSTSLLQRRLSLMHLISSQHQHMLTAVIHTVIQHILLSSDCALDGQLVRSLSHWRVEDIQFALLCLSFGLSQSHMTSSSLVLWLQVGKSCFLSHHPRSVHCTRVLLKTLSTWIPSFHSSRQTDPSIQLQSVKSFHSVSTILRDYLVFITNSFQECHWPNTHRQLLVADVLTLAQQLNQRETRFGTKLTEAICQLINVVALDTTMDHKGNAINRIRQVGFYTSPSPPSMEHESKKVWELDGFELAQRIDQLLRMEEI